MAGCPQPPYWQPITANRKELWLAANLAIEQVYKKENGEDGVLVGSDFVGTGGFGMSRLRLPSNATNKEFGDFLLDRLNSTKNENSQRQPDIVDFKTSVRAFYEIKPARQYETPGDREKVARQHRSLYEVASRAVDEFNQMKRNTTHGGSLVLQDPWTISNSKWMPPETISLPGSGGNVIICTSPTRAAYATNPGIILYQLYRKSLREQDNVQQVAKVVVQEKDSTYDKLTISEQTIIAQLPAYDPNEPEHLVIVPKALYDSLRNKNLDQATGNTRPATPPTSGHSAFWKGALIVTTVVGIVLLVTGVGEIILGGEAAVGTGAAVGAGGAEATGGMAAADFGAGARIAAGASRAGGNVITFTGKKLMETSAAGRLQNAAGVLLIVGQVQQAAAQTTTFSKISAVRLIPLSSVTPYKGQQVAYSSGLCAADSPESLQTSSFNVKLGSTVMFDSEPYVVVARIIPYPNLLEK